MIINAATLPTRLPHHLLHLYDNQLDGGKKINSFNQLDTSKVFYLLIVRYSKFLSIIQTRDQILKYRETLAKNGIVRGQNEEEVPFCRTMARNIFFPGRGSLPSVEMTAGKVEMLLPLSFEGGVPVGEGRGAAPAVISKRSEKSPVVVTVVVPCGGGLLQEISPSGRDDNGGRSR